MAFLRFFPRFVIYSQFMGKLFRSLLFLCFIKAFIAFLAKYCSDV